MAQVTIYLDSEAETRAKDAAKASNVSLSKWIADLIREKTDSSWPDSVRRLAGAWPDFPELGDIRAKPEKDVEREAL